MEPNENIKFLIECISRALMMMTQFSNIPEDELFKICLDFWNKFCYDIMVKLKGSEFFNNCKYKC